MTEELKGKVEIKACLYRREFTHNLCNELTRLQPKIKYGWGHRDWKYNIIAIPRKYENVNDQRTNEEKSPNHDQ